MKKLMRIDSVSFSFMIILIVIIPIINVNNIFLNLGTIICSISDPDVIFIDGDDTQAIKGVISINKRLFTTETSVNNSGGEFIYEEAVNVQCNNMWTMWMRVGLLQIFFNCKSI